jgi:hypothetical protein
VGTPICQPESARQELAPSLKEDTLQFEGLPDTGSSAMVQACLDDIPEFAHRRRMNLADGPNLNLIEMACQFQGSAIRVQQFLPTREYQNAGSVAHRVIQRTRFGDRSPSE